MTSETVVDALSVSEETVLETCGEPDFPEMGVIEQVWETDPILPSDVRSSASDALHSLSLDTVPADGQVALGVGSRGIANIPEIVAGVVEDVGGSRHRLLWHQVLGVVLLEPEPFGVADVLEATEVRVVPRVGEQLRHCDGAVVEFSPPRRVGQVHGAVRLGVLAGQHAPT